MVVGRERGGRAQQRLVVGEHPGRAEGYAVRQLVGGRWARRKDFWIYRQETAAFRFRGRGGRGLVGAKEEVAQRGQVVHLLVHLHALVEHIATADWPPRRRGSSSGNP